MPLFDLLDLIFAAATMGVALLGCSLALARAATSPPHKLLSVLFATQLFIQAEILVAHWLSTEHASLVLPFDMALTIAVPAVLWRYVCVLTDTKDKWNWCRILIWLPTAYALCVAIFACIQPLSVRLFIFSDLDGPAPQGVELLPTAIKSLILLHLAQLPIFYFLILKRLIQFRLQLRQLYASNERRELGWIFVVMGILGAVVFLFLVEEFIDLGSFGNIARNVLAIAGVWVMAQWGLRQLPGILPDDQNAISVPAETKGSDLSQKYARSALSAEHRDRIAQKIEQAMQKEQLYLNANLSLSELASAIQVPSNYVSQTLNTTLGDTFFDYINKQRITAALPLLANTEKTVLDIAMTTGFNARSSFYKAFKQQTKMTPSAWRKSHKK